MAGNRGQAWFWLEWDTIALDAPFLSFSLELSGATSGFYSKRASRRLAESLGEADSLSIRIASGLRLTYRNQEGPDRTPFAAIRGRAGDRPSVHVFPGSGWH